MDIIFKCGPHYYENGDSSFWIQVLIAFLGAFFGFGFALIIYYYQTKKVRLNDARNELQEKMNKLEYYALLLDNIIRILKTQKELIRDYITNQRGDPSKLQSLKRIATNDFIRLNTIDSKGIFESIGYFFGNDGTNWIKSYREVNSCLDYLETLSEEINNLYESNYDTFNANVNSINGIVEFIKNSLLSLKLMNSHNLDKTRYDVEIHELVDGYIKLYKTLVDNNATVFELELKFVTPLLNELMKNEGKYHFTEVFSEYCRTVITKLNTYKMDLDKCLNELERSAQTIDKPLNNIVKFNEEIKKRALSRS